MFPGAARFKVKLSTAPRLCAPWVPAGRVDVFHRGFAGRRDTALSEGTGSTFSIAVVKWRVVDVVRITIGGGRDNHEPAAATPALTLRRSEEHCENPSIVSHMFHFLL